VNLDIYHREMELHRKAAAERRAQGIVQFDGCPHYERASQALAAAAVEEADRLKAQRQQALQGARG
jgi:hypothetical protein